MVSSGRYRGYYFFHRRLRDWQRIKAKYFQNFVHIHINKTGGSSVNKALNGYFEHKTAQEKINELGPKRWAKRFTFAIVRNPWDRAVSQYFWRRDFQESYGTSNISFEEWLRLAFIEKDPQICIKPVHFLSQWEWITDENGEVLVDFVGRFERLDEEFQLICKRIGRDGTTLPHIRQSRRGPYEQYYNQESKQIIAEYFKDDLEHFGYRFGFP